LSNLATQGKVALAKTQEQEKLNVRQEKLPGSRIGLEIEIAAERLQRAYEQTVTQFMRSAQIPGFRRGKVPRQVILQRVGVQALKAETLEDLIQKTLKEAIEQEKIDAIGNFQLSSSFDELVAQFQDGSAVTYSASVDVPPEVTLKKHTGFTVKAEEEKYDPQQVEKILEEQRASRATLVPVEGRPAQASDVAIVDFSGRYYLEGDSGQTEEIEGGQATDFQIELGEGQFIPGFVDGMIGMEPGQTKEITAKFPEEYFQEDLAGKSAAFTVTLRDLKAKELPELDDEFAKDVSEFETLAALREFLEERYQSEAKGKTDGNIDTALLDALVAELEAEIPETLITNETNFLINQMAMRLQSQGMDVKKLFTEDLIEGLRERSRDEAIGRIKRTLALAEVAKKESLQVETEALEQRFQEVITQTRDRSNIDRDRLREALEEELLQAKVLNWLKEQSTVELVESGSLQPEAPAEDKAADSETADSETANSEAADSETDTEEKSSQSPAKSKTKSKAATEEPETEESDEKPKAKRSRTPRTKTSNVDE
jgi:trigger factor